MLVFGEPTGGQTYYVVFDKRRGNKCRWWHCLLNKNYNHVFLVAGYSKELTLIINPLHWGVFNNIINCSIDDTLLLFKQEKVTEIIEVTTKIKTGGFYRFRGIYSCVCLVKAILNIRGLSITPLALAKYLKKQGCKTVG